METLFEIYMIRYRYIHKFKKFIKAMVKWALSGFKRPSKKLIAKREAICNGCEYFIKSRDKCTDCGCFMPLKWQIKNQNCPQGKW